MNEIECLDDEDYIISDEEDFEYEEQDPEIIFLQNVRELLEEIDQVCMSYDNFNRKISLFIRIFQCVKEHAQMLLTVDRFAKFVKTIIEKVAELKLNLPVKYNEYNKIKRFQPESKRLYRKLRDLLVAVEECLLQQPTAHSVAPLVRVEDEVSNEVVDEVSNEVVEQQVLRRSPRLAAKQHF
jgi:hypothetical protein